MAMLTHYIFVPNKQKQQQQQHSNSGIHLTTQQLQA